MAPRGRPKKESSKIIVEIVKSEKYEKYFLLDENNFHIPRKHESKNEDNVFSALMNEPMIANFHPTVCSIYEVLESNEKDIKKYFENALKKRLKTVNVCAENHPGKQKEEKTAVLLGLVKSKYSYILDGRLPPRKDGVYTQILAEVELEPYRADMTSVTLFKLIQSHEKSLRKEIAQVQLASQHEANNNEATGSNETGGSIREEDFLKNVNHASTPLSSLLSKN